MLCEIRVSSRATVRADTSPEHILPARIRADSRGRVQVVLVIRIREIERSHHVLRLRIVQFRTLLKPTFGLGVILRHSDSEVINISQKTIREPAAFFGGFMKKREGYLLILLNPVSKKIGNAKIRLGADQSTCGGKLIPVECAYRISENADACLIEIADLELRPEDRPLQLPSRTKTPRASNPVPRRVPRGSRLRAGSAPEWCAAQILLALPARRRR